MPSTEDIALDLWLDRLASGRAGRLAVRSGSMAPLIRLDDAIEVGPPPRRLWPGQLIVFREGNRLICHRLMMPCAPGRYWQKGDFNPNWEQVAAADIVGAPTAVLEGSRRYLLEGAAFAFRNTLLWLVVALRDLARFCGRRLPRGSWTIERIFAEPIRVLVKAIRQEGEPT